MPPRGSSARSTEAQQSPSEIANLVVAFLREHASAVVLEDGKVLFDMAEAQHSLSTEHGHCTLHLWGAEGNTVRRIVAADERSGVLRLSTLRFGQSQPKLLELAASRSTRAPTSRDSSRQRYMRLLERVLVRHYAEWKPQGFRTAMDLERSFGPAYSRGSLVRGKQAWAVIGTNQHESPATVDGILTLGILWLHQCRENGGGRRLYQGLRVIVPKGMAMLTQSRMAWLNDDAAHWELFELDEHTEELTACDADDTGNLRTRLVHRPSEAAAKERFANAVQTVMELVPAGEEARVEQRLRSGTELAFLLHGLEFARAHVSLSTTSFSSSLTITVGSAENETALTEKNRDELGAFVADLFRRRSAATKNADYSKRGHTPARRIGAATSLAAHSRLRNQTSSSVSSELNPQQDALYRASPERWLESVLRLDLAPLTRGLATEPEPKRRNSRISELNATNYDAVGNRALTTLEQDEERSAASSRLIPRLDPEHVYTQVPAIAGASDRGMLDMLGVTADGRLAVIELKADDDLQLALQGLDYWIRVRHHHLQGVDLAIGLGEFQQRGYFVGVELSPLPPRLYLVAPALHIHPATETVLRYISPRVEWTLLALDERWRQEIRVVWRKSNERLSRGRDQR